ncbi:glycosyltransferase [Paenibacillus taiwanensis]|uniref:glycosyltransferase n=1 Tax=Paenibacillus taiwanensis TaxID=401638 RepID=UPI00040C54C9|nr:glycosyltransferase [Paenibacillus taiwanensis]
MCAPKISLCMIVKNEEVTLGRCLDSVINVVDEIVVVDTGSTDRTLEILKERGIEAQHYTWNNHFGDARNYALSFATGQFILQLDADEYLDQETKSVLCEPLDCDYYILRIRNDLGSGFNEVHSSIRLFRNLADLKYTGALHEHIEIKDMQLKRGSLQALIHHDGYKQAVIDKKNKNKRNMQIIKKEAKLNPNAFNLYNLGVQLKIEEDFLAAIDAFKKSFAAGSNYTFTPKLLVYLGQCLMKLKRYEEALAVFNDSIALYSDYTDLHYFKGFVYDCMEYYRDAESCYKKCLQLGEAPEVYHNSQEGVGTYLAHAQLAELYFKEGRRDEALTHAIEALRGSHNSFPTLKVFLNIYPGGDRQQIYEILKQVWSINTSADFEMLLLVLYQLRHPLLLSYIKEFKINVPNSLQRFILLLDKKYEEAAKCELEHSVGNTKDMLLQSFVLQNGLYFDQVADQINLNAKEVKILRKMIAGEEVKETNLSSAFYTYLADLLQDLFHLQEYNIIDYFGGPNVQDPAIKLLLGQKLTEFEFYDVVLNVLVEGQSSIMNAKIFETAARALEFIKDPEFIYYYKKCSEIKPSFNIWYRLYEGSLKSGNRLETTTYLEKLKSMKPASEWVKNL